jgi:hypothetical protein
MGDGCQSWTGIAIWDLHARAVPHKKITSLSQSDMRCNMLTTSPSLCVPQISSRHPLFVLRAPCFTFGSCPASSSSWKHHQKTGLIGKNPRRVTEPINGSQERRGFCFLWTCCARSSDHMLLTKQCVAKCVAAKTLQSWGKVKYADY